MEMDILKSILSENEVTPLGSLNGTPLYSFEDAQRINKIGLVKEKIQGKEVEFGERPMRPDGLGYLETKANAIAVPTSFFENRYRKVEIVKTSLNEKTKKEETVKDVYYEVVTDYRACKEQASGRVYTTTIHVYQIGAKKDSKGNADLFLIGQRNISDADFINEFKGKLNKESMVKILKLIGNNPAKQVEDTLEF
jgi:hypothetical protein|nr:MAG TPA: hypothetical protein [Caudoviricetes sp.]